MVLLGYQYYLHHKNVSVRKRSGGSKPGRRENRESFRKRRIISIDSDYFFCLPQHAVLEPIFSEEEFLRQYCVSRETYEEMRTALLINPRRLFREGTNFVGNASAYTDQKLIVAFRMLTEGMYVDRN